MTEYLLKRALPFTLTFIVGAAAGGFFNLFAARDTAPRARRYTQTYEGGRSCGQKSRRRASAPESRPRIILFKPDARFPRRLTEGEAKYGVGPVGVRVTFGGDGKVSGAESVGSWPREVSEAAERAARQIQFVPATRDGAPAAVTEEVEIRFSFD